MVYVIERCPKNDERWPIKWDVNYKSVIEFESKDQVDHYCESMNESDSEWDYFYTPLGGWENAQKLASPEVCKGVNDILSKGAAESFAELIKLKFTSGNDIPVDSIRLSREEAQAFMNWCCRDN